MKYDYLDKGYVKYVGHFGEDRLIAKAARASFVREAYKSDEMNWSLIDYLFYNWHMSPIEMASITFESKIPIFVMRQHVRHRTFKLNEQSLRYVTHDGDYYLPALDRMHTQSEDTKQGSGILMSPHLAETRREMMRDAFEAQWKAYKLLLDEREVEVKGKKEIKAHGLTKELARSILGTGFYTTVVWQADLRNLGNYLFLRSDPHAQYEIQEHAKIVANIYKECFPRTYEAFEENWLNGKHFSAKEVAALRDLLQNTSKDDVLASAKNHGIKESRLSSFLKKITG